MKHEIEGNMIKFLQGSNYWHQQLFWCKIFKKITILIETKQSELTVNWYCLKKIWLTKYEIMFLKWRRLQMVHEKSTIGFFKNQWVIRRYNDVRFLSHTFVWGHLNSLSIGGYDCLLCVIDWVDAASALFYSKPAFECACGRCKGLRPVSTSPWRLEHASNSWPALLPGTP